MLPFVGLTPESFEHLVRDLFNAKEATNSYTIFGRPGQAQAGIDIYSSTNQTAIQCKLIQDPRRMNKAKLQKAIETEVSKLKEAAVHIRTYIFATTYPHDVDMINFCESLTFAMGKWQVEQLKIEILFLGWNEISNWALRLPSIAKMYFSDLTPNLNVSEIVRLQVVESECNWRNNRTDTNSFLHEEGPSGLDCPVFDLIVVNNSENTQILAGVDVYNEALFSGFHGFPPIGTGRLGYSDIVAIEITGDKDWNSFVLPDPIFLTPKAPLRLQLLLYETDSCGKAEFFTGLRKMQFRLNFGTKESIFSDWVYLNCTPTIPYLQLITIE